MKIEGKNNEGLNFKGIRFDLSDKIISDNADALQSMVEMDFEEKKVIFTPFNDFDLFSISFQDDFLRHMAAINSYLPLEKDQDEQIQQNIDISA